MTGKYGQIYDRIDGGVIMNWFLKYKQERLANIEAMQNNPDLPESWDSMPVEIQKKLNDLWQKLKMKTQEQAFGNEGEPLEYMPEYEPNKTFYKTLKEKENGR